MITVVKPASGAAPAKMATTHPNALTEVLLTFKKEFIVVGIFSAVVNLLMLTPTLYLLQVFDRAHSPNAIMANKNNVMRDTTNSVVTLCPFNTRSNT